MNEPLTITCTSDEKYLKYLEPLVNSINENTINTRLYIRLVNVPKDKASNIYNLHPSVEILWDNKELCTKRCLLNGDNGLISFIEEGKDNYGYLLSEKICYCSNIKYNTINKLLKRSDPYILHMDVDAIVRKDLTELVELIKQHDIIIRKDITNYSFRSTSEPYGETYRQGVIGVNNTDVTRRLFTEIEHRVNLDMKNWDADQINFYHVFESMKNEIRFHNLPISYRDTCHDHMGGDSTGGTLSDESHIWSGSYKTKHTQSQYIAEWNRYR